MSFSYVYVTSKKSSHNRLYWILISVLLILLPALLWQIYFDVPDLPDMYVVDFWTISHVFFYIFWLLIFSYFFNFKKVLIFLIFIAIGWEILEYLLSVFIPSTRWISWEILPNVVADIIFNLIGLWLGYYLLKSIQKKEKKD